MVYSIDHQLKFKEILRRYDEYLYELGIRSKLRTRYLAKIELLLQLATAYSARIDEEFLEFFVFYYLYFSKAWSGVLKKRALRVAAAAIDACRYFAELQGKKTAAARLLRLERLLCRLGQQVGEHWLQELRGVYQRQVLRLLCFAAYCGKELDQLEEDDIKRFYLLELNTGHYVHVETSNSLAVQLGYMCAKALERAGNQELARQLKKISVWKYYLLGAAAHRSIREQLDDAAAAVLLLAHADRNLSLLELTQLRPAHVDAELKLLTVGTKKIPLSTQLLEFFSARIGREYLFLPEERNKRVLALVDVVLKKIEEKP
ncbi:MAG: hypothetical protein GXO42_00480 [bacterium]|nr:hypothetical protein [bacterium]